MFFSRLLDSNGRATHVMRNWIEDREGHGNKTKTGAFCSWHVLELLVGMPFTQMHKIKMWLPATQPLPSCHVQGHHPLPEALCTFDACPYF